MGIATLRFCTSQTFSHHSTLLTLNIIEVCFAKNNENIAEMNFRFNDACVIESTVIVQHYFQRFNGNFEQEANNLRRQNINEHPIIEIINACKEIYVI